MPKFDAHTETLVRKALSFDDVGQELRARMTTLQSELQAMEWTGGGGASFESVRVRYEADVNKLHNSLATLSQKVGEAAKEYTGTDMEAAQEMESAGAGAGDISAKLMV